MSPPPKPAATPFTVIELLTVLMLVIMLFVIAIPLFVPAKKNSPATEAAPPARP